MLWRQVVDVDSYNPLGLVADFCTLIATYPQVSYPSLPAFLPTSK